MTVFMIITTMILVKMMMMMLMMVVVMMMMMMMTLMMVVVMLMMRTTMVMMLLFDSPESFLIYVSRVERALINHRCATLGHWKDLMTFSDQFDTRLVGGCPFYFENNSLSLDFLFFFCG